jgi:hypothetical protein
MLRGTFKNCYGIENFTLKEIKFSESNKAIIYAPNGVMKSSLARTFEQLSLKELPEDRIFPDRITHFSITYKDKSITQETTKADLDCLNTFVINSFDEAYQSENISNLLINPELRRKYQRLIKEFDKDLTSFISSLIKLSKVPMKSIHDIICADFSLNRDLEWTDLLLWFEWAIENHEIDEAISSVQYNQLFNDKTLTLLQDENFIRCINTYVGEVNKLLNESDVLSNSFNDHNASELGKTFNKHNLFASNNKVILNNGVTISSKHEWDNAVKQELDKIKNNPNVAESYNKISSVINKNAQATGLRKILESNDAILLRLSDIDGLRKSLWLNYLKSLDSNYIALLNSIKQYKNEIEKLVRVANDNQPKWQSTIDEFNNRFRTPYKLEIQNQANVILKNEVPQIVFVFEDEDTTIKKTHTEMMQILSMGERRALYLLNVLFDTNLVIEKAQSENRHALIILDDIADSFDYKNKYSIIEYVNDISSNTYIDVLLLTHNFDFYRTVRNRIGIGIGHKNSFVVQKHNSNNISMSKFGYTKDVFQAMVVKPLKSGEINTLQKEKWLIAGIPFLRNLSDYLGKENHYDTLTELLHIKANTATYKIEQLWDIYIDVIGSEPINYADKDKKVLRKIYEFADVISQATGEAVNLENKIIMSMAIRLKAEEVMRSISEARGVTLPTSDSKQAREWYDAIKPSLLNQEIHVFEQVLMMTSENIHINAFMYEPIIDISDWHLKQLYSNLKALE